MLISNSSLFSHSLLYLVHVEKKNKSLEKRLEIILWLLVIISLTKNIHLTQHFSKNEWDLYFNFIWYIRYQNKVFKPIQTFPCLSEDGYNKFSEVLLEDSNAKEYFVFLF